jgi:hypothetical protein
LDWILSFFVSLDDQIARISRMKASIFFVILARSGPKFCSRQIPLKKEMVKHVPDAGSYAPVTVLVDERADGVHLSYDRMASFLAPYWNRDALDVARNLDKKSTISYAGCGLSMTVAAERALFVIALGSGERVPARWSTGHHCEV